MEVKESGRQQGWYSLLRWRSDVARDEARNVALLLVDARGGFDAFKAAPLSTISPRLHEQGVLDAALVALEQQFGESKFTLERLQAAHERLQNSLQLTEPQPVAVRDVEETANALYRAFIATRGGGGNTQSKSAVLDRVVAAYRKRGFDVKRGAYVGDFIFDAVLREGRTSSVVEVLSFAAPRKDWTPVERDAGHFLFALKELGTDGKAVIVPPARSSAPNSGQESYSRITRWLTKAKVPVLAPEDVTKPQGTLALGQ